MCIRDRYKGVLLSSKPKFKGSILFRRKNYHIGDLNLFYICLLYTSDAADERSSVDLGGRRIIKKKKNIDDDGRRINIKTQKNIN